MLVSRKLLSFCCTLKRLIFCIRAQIYYTRCTLCSSISMYPSSWGRPRTIGVVDPVGSAKCLPHMHLPFIHFMQKFCHTFEGACAIFGPCAACRWPLGSIASHQSPLHASGTFRTTGIAPQRLWRPQLRTVQGFKMRTLQSPQPKPDNDAMRGLREFRKVQERSILPRQRSAPRRQSKRKA